MTQPEVAKFDIVKLLSRLEKADTPETKEALIGRFVRPGKPVIVSFLNAHAVNLAAVDTQFLNALFSSDYLLRDGSGVKIGCKLFDVSPGINLNGTDLIPELFTRYKGRKVALFGAESYWLIRAQAILRNGAYDFGALICLDGFRAEQDYLDMVLAKQPELIVLGMGMPRQEQLALKIRDLMAQAQIPCTIVNGGAIIDFIAGKFPRAPLWIRQAGFEWAYRLACEPRRLAKRYIVGNPLFIARIVRAKLAA